MRSYQRRFSNNFAAVKIRIMTGGAGSYITRSDTDDVVQRIGSTIRRSRRFLDLTRELPQLFPFHSTKRFPSFDCFRGLLFRLFPGLPMPVNPLEKHSPPSFFVDKDVPRHSSRKNHSFFSIGSKSHSGIIPPFSKTVKTLVSELI